MVGEDAQLAAAEPYRALAVAVIHWWWSALLTVVGVLGLALAGSKKISGWAVGLGAQVLWVTYAIVTEQWGFIGSAVLYGSVYFINMRKWINDRNRV